MNRRNDIPENIGFYLLWDDSNQTLINRSSRKAVGYTDSEGYRKVKYNGKLYQMSRVVYFLTYGVQPDIIRYLDGDKNNLSVSNLISIESRHNPILKKWRETTGYKDIRNIYPIVSRGKVAYQVRICINGTSHSNSFRELSDALTYAIEIYKCNVIDQK